MPWVIVNLDIYKHTSPETVKRIQRACRAAWASMADKESGAGKGPYKEEDVGGCAVRLVSTVVTDVALVYTNRGFGFNADLDAAMQKELFREFGGSLPLSYKPRPIEPEMWFDNPVWSQAPCTRPHADENREDDIPF